MVKTQGPHGKSSPDVTHDQMLICEEHKTTFGWCCSSLIELSAGFLLIRRFLSRR